MGEHERRTTKHDSLSVQREIQPNGYGSSQEEALHSSERSGPGFTEGVTRVGTHRENRMIKCGEEGSKGIPAAPERI